MIKQDITKNEFYIVNFYGVFRAEHRRYNKTAHIKSRSCDVFMYLLEGSCVYTLDDGSVLDARAGDFLYLPKGASYSLLFTEKTLKFIFCDFEFNSDTARKGAVFSSDNNKFTENLFLKLLNIYKLKNEAYFSDALSVLYTIYSTARNVLNTKYINVDSKKRIIDSKNYIDVHYNDVSLTVSSIADDAGISEVYFRKLFKAEFGLSPSKYILSVRLSNAKKLMKNPFLSLEECAKLSGFESLQYFCRVFKKEIGDTPAKYRKAKTLSH